MAQKQPAKTRQKSASTKLRSTPPSTDEMDRIFGSLKKRGDTDQVLLGGAYLEHGLQQLLESRFAPLSDDPDLKDRLFNAAAGGILGAFAAKIRVARAMSLIGPDTYSDLMLILEIRNTFAHSMHEISFKHSAITEDIHKLYAKKYIGFVLRHMIGIDLPIDDPGQIFRATVVGLCSAFRSKITETASVFPLNH